MVEQEHSHMLPLYISYDIFIIRRYFIHVHVDFIRNIIRNNDIHLLNSSFGFEMCWKKDIQVLVPFVIGCYC